MAALILCSATLGAALRALSCGRIRSCSKH
jgi:hypothetical protein